MHNIRYQERKNTLFFFKIFLQGFFLPRKRGIHIKTWNQTWI